MSDRRARALRLLKSTAAFIWSILVATARREEQRALHDIAKMNHAMLEQQTALTLAITTLVVQTAPKPPKDDRWPMEKTSDT